MHRPLAPESFYFFKTRWLFYRRCLSFKIVFAERLNSFHIAFTGCLLPTCLLMVTLDVLVSFFSLILDRHFVASAFRLVRQSSLPIHELNRVLTHGCKMSATLHPTNPWGVSVFSHALFPPLSARHPLLLRRKHGMPNLSFDCHMLPLIEFSFVLSMFAAKP